MQLTGLALESTGAPDGAICFWLGSTLVIRITFRVLHYASRNQTFSPCPYSFSPFHVPQLILATMRYVLVSGGVISGISRPCRPVGSR